MSLRKAINEKCRDCIYDPKSGLGNWRQQVEGCTIQSCSLWPYRPKSSGSRSSGADLAPIGTEQGDGGTVGP
jgi:hypothetical protein